MCVTKCINLDCHEAIYGRNELELGEIDEERALRFEGCVKDALKKEESEDRKRRQERQKEKEQIITNTDAVANAR